MFTFQSLNRTHDVCSVPCTFRNHYFSTTDAKIAEAVRTYMKRSPSNSHTVWEVTPEELMVEVKAHQGNEEAIEAAELIAKKRGRPRVSMGVKVVQGARTHQVQEG